MFYSVPEATRLAKSVFPTWIEERGCVLRADGVSRENLEKWWDYTGGDCRRIEAGMNHLHLWDLVPGSGEADVEELRELGHVIVAAWRSGLKAAFPERRFAVTLIDAYGPTIEAVSVDQAA